MRIFITGGNSFLGHHVLPLLQNANIEYEAPRSFALNILDYTQLSYFVFRMKPDAILHMAALCGGILANKNRPADFLHANTQMALNIYEVARQCEVPYVYSLGSVCMYPEHCSVPFKEDDIWKGYPEKTNAAYGQAKRTLLMLSQTYRQQYGVKGVHLVPVNLYGPHDHFDLVNSHVIPALVRKFDNAVHNNSPYVECWGTGDATREFLYAEDAAEAIVKTVLNKFDFDVPINLGLGIDISIKHLALLIKDLTGFTGDIIFNGAVSDGQPKRLLDVSRARNLLNWSARTDLPEGLIKTIKWYQKNRGLIPV
jgi:GDP-L-fucose synthase